MRNSTLRHLLLFLAVALSISTCRQTEHIASWTVMVYLNGDNELNDFAMADFNEMASVGSTQETNIVVQFDRQGTEVSGPNWSQTLRFLVLKGMSATVKNAYADLGEQDMASGSTVEDFVRSSINAFPARHYALVLWGHGSGSRRPAAQAYSGDQSTPVPDVCNGWTSRVVSPFKGGTNDGSDIGGKQMLYMRELEDALKRALRGKRIDVVVFDECVMGMVENAYALRDTVDYMVASQEMIPWDGFDYRKWMSALTAKPSMAPSSFATMLVRSYESVYRESFACRTMSAIDVKKMPRLGRALSHLADALILDLTIERQAIIDTRTDCKVYGNPDCAQGSCYYHVDLIRFCERLQVRSDSPAIRQSAEEVILSAKAAILCSEAGTSAMRLKGSNGLSIYFPPDGNGYCADRTNLCGYESKNRYFPLEFVQQVRWSEFLRRYFKAVPDVFGQAAPVSPCVNAEKGCEGPE